ncbi:MAG: hypothetical protein KIT80_13335 [Chitinophagaceae bacterium]|nr:hypothetical protein [Chitinophagaceae bacterium]MCW5927891.1 hypothetical protein [Chitinophagaceae bacterium]
MKNERKIKPVVRKVTYEVAEDIDDRYWMNATEEERFNELASLRMMLFGAGKIKKIQKVIRKRSLHEEAD